MHSRAAWAHGVEILLNSPVERILSNDGRAWGIRIAGGRVLEAKVILSTADPRRAFLELMEPDSLPAEFIHTIRNIKIHGAAMKVNLALSELPNWNALPGGPGPQHPGSTNLCPSFEYAEAAFMDAKHGVPSRNPWMEIVTQSVLDPSVAPSGKHTLSVYVQYTPSGLRIMGRHPRVVRRPRRRDGGRVCPEPAKGDPCPPGSHPSRP